MRRRTFVLLTALSYAVLFALPFLAILTPGFSPQLTPTAATLFALLNLFALSLIYVGTAFLAVKRLQDMNTSGEVALMTLLPGGFLLLLWIAAQPPVDTREGGNRYGRNPRVAQKVWWRVSRGEGPNERPNRRQGERFEREQTRANA